MKNKGFSFIEIVIAIAIIAVLSTLITPQVRNQLAKGKDTKAVATLSSLRIASQMYQMEHSEKLISSEDYDSDEKIKEAFRKLSDYLDPSAKKILSEAKVEIGGSRTTKDADLQYGGDISFTFKNPDENGKSDGVYLWFKLTTGIGAFDSRGVEWKSY
ncbi:prepilin-type N-terminal cleavage/methylation domain-containing protein [Fusobacterium necrophorum]|uniref:Prepilin-type N-terminal cleavage/methylation domain-containing protein n=1 Tax=Fusobacterium necrophorum TaxID=859 RepID=A0A4Q2KSM8_9FUSO|nr:prepilin-type N-terminal cleavage/methylation domain-containing protein [Fusobacterium necrophorum]RXZ68485.1 prepilin-type N-terminal cleavage/methylation domain-containing protein [Fusobacterium necrophorum]